MKIAMLPYVTSPVHGGVLNCSFFLSRELEKLGHTVTGDTAGADVVHGHAFDGSPNVYTSHGIYPKDHFNEDANGILFSNIASADVVTCVSKWTAEQIGHTGKHRVIHNGVDLKLLDQYRNFKDKKFVLWGKATADEVANPEAFIELARSRPDLNFAMIVAPSVQLPKNVKVLGIQSHDKMLKLLADASVLVSTGTENFPIQVLEALGLGTPVLALPRGGVSEVMGAYVTNKLGDGLEDLLSRRQYHSDFGLQSVKSNYQWSDIVNQYLEVYEQSRKVEHNGRVSVVIPCYNLANKVKRAVESVLTQAVKADEIIVIDDGSTDHPDDALHEYKDKITFVRQDNSGVSAARNNGIRKATGEYVCCLDADDALSIDFLEVTKRAFNADKRIGLAYTGMRVVDQYGRMVSDFPGEAHPNLDKLQRGNFIPCANLFRKQAWLRAGGYKNINPSWEDYDLWLSILEAGYLARYAIGARLVYTASDTGRTGESIRDNHDKLLKATVDGYHPNLYGRAGLVSIIIPCYNQWEYVRDAVSSAFHQTYQHVEVIVIDDKSIDDDKTQSNAASLIGEFPNLRVIWREQNGGLSAARNTGLAEAKGEWVIPLDADDKLDPTFVAECLKVVYTTDKYAYTDIWIWHNLGKGPLEKMETPEFNPDRLKSKHIHACAILVKRDWLLNVGGYDEQMRDGWEDYEMVLRLVKSGHCGVRIPKTLFYYRWRPNSMRQDAELKSDKINAYIWNKHQDVAKGASLMACCGGGVAVQVNNNNLNQLDIVVPEGYVLIQYRGNKAGDMTKHGGNNRMYRFNSTSPIFPVKEEDLMAFTGPTFMLVQNVQVSQSEPVQAPMPVDFREVLPEGEDDFSLLGMTEDQIRALAGMEVTTYQRLIALPDTDLAEVVTKKLVKKFKTAAMAKVKEGMVETVIE